MVLHKKPHFSAFAAALVLPLAACGGGGVATGGEFVGAAAPSSTTVTETPAGLYAGIASNGRYFNTLVLENNQYYIIYGALGSQAFSPAGLIAGTGLAANRSFTSTDLKEFPAFGLPLLGALSGTYVPAASFSAVVTTRGTAVTYAGMALNNANYVYDTRAKLTDIAGAWNVLSGTGQSASLSISSSGIITGTSAGCDVAGTIAPRASGKNVFDVTMRFGPSPCALADQAVTGSAVSYLLAAGNRQLLIAASDATGSVATAFAGVR